MNHEHYLLFHIITLLKKYYNLSQNELKNKLNDVTIIYQPYQL